MKDRADSLPRDGRFNGLGVVTSLGLFAVFAQWAAFSRADLKARGVVRPKLQPGVQKQSTEGETWWKELVLGRGEVAVEDVKSSCDRGIDLTDLS